MGQCGRLLTSFLTVAFGVAVSLSVAEARRGGGGGGGGGHIGGGGHHGGGWKHNGGSHHRDGGMHHGRHHGHHRHGYWRNGVWIATGAGAVYGYTGTCAYAYQRWRETGNVYW